MIDSKRVYQLTGEFGSPLYIFDEVGFVNNYKHFVNCFKNIYDKYVLSYSYKTNYAPYICRLVKSLGGYPEVVSDMELEIARTVGNPDSNIVYNGPCKGELLEDFILHGGMANVDNMEELERIIQFAHRNPDKSYSIGIRVNIDIGQGFISRFGIDETDLCAVFDKIKGVSNLEIVGLHCHIGRSRSIKAWENRANKMIEISDRYFENAPRYISLGSGMFGEMSPELAGQFGPDIPSYEEYAHAVALPIAEHFKGDDRPILFTEPGTTLINKYIYFVTRVTSIKKIKGKTFIVMDGSKHNMGEICELKNLPIKVLSNAEYSQSVSGADLVGYTCLEHDVLYRGFDGKISDGDFVMFENVGGYSNVSKPPFIKPNCCMVTADGKVIKRAETVKEVIYTYE